MSIRRSMSVRLLLIIYAAAALSVLSCRRGGAKSGAKPEDLRRSSVQELIKTKGVEGSTTSRLGSQLGPDGTVAVEKSIFTSGEPIRLTMWFQISPPHLQTSAHWYDAENKEIREDRQMMHGEKITTFSWSGKPLKPGKYRVIGYWGGNVAADHQFEVEAAPKPH